jgi:hypothetical protein
MMSPQGPGTSLAYGHKAPTFSRSHSTHCQSHTVTQTRPQFLAVVRPPPRPARLPRNIKIGKMIGKLGNLLMFLAVVWLRQRPACLANWQTQFFFGLNLYCVMLLRRQRSLPTVANSIRLFRLQPCPKSSMCLVGILWTQCPGGGGKDSVPAGRGCASAAKRRSSACVS